PQRLPRAARGVQPGEAQLHRAVMHQPHAIGRDRPAVAQSVADEMVSKHHNPHSLGISASSASADAASFTAADTAALAAAHATAPAAATPIVTGSGQSTARTPAAAAAIATTALNSLMRSREFTVLASLLSI